LVTWMKNLVMKRTWPSADDLIDENNQINFEFWLNVVDYFGIEYFVLFFTKLNDYY